jgi:hypothetical protein
MNFDSEMSFGLVVLDQRGWQRVEAARAAITTVHMNRLRFLCVHSVECNVCTAGKIVCVETTAGQRRERSNFEWRERENSIVEEAMVREKSSVREGMIKGDCERDIERDGDRHSVSFNSVTTLRSFCSAKSIRTACVTGTLCCLPNGIMVIEFGGTRRAGRVWEVCEKPEMHTEFWCEICIIEPPKVHS